MTQAIQQPTRALPLTLMNDRAPIRVLMIGAGGNGSELFDGLVKLHSALVALGGKGLDVTVLDDDEVSESNVIRQRFYPHEVGQNKAIAVVQRANLMMGTNWQALPVRFTGSEVSTRPDLVITAVDNLEARRAAIRAFTPSREHSRTSLGRVIYSGSQMDTFWLDLGCDKDRGQVVMGRFGDNTMTDEWPNALAHFPEMIDREDEEDKPSCSAAESLARQDLMINQAVSGQAINMLWKLMRSGQIAFNGVVIELANGFSQAIPFLPHQSDNDGE
ncbi:hypothetical protein AWH63_11015 [Marinobacter sp. C18]|uniref:PRTRC system ThiF family protein n=1 Tax=Marinobacter sp. C18 TaxID=1772288 RepID=UPI000948E083|nr:PRTRC system ThiF family protein [Marinobacter sp. C18]OLF82062.1 hypothetical protein AWH63_11015 [Marinobacter sp. C18]